MSDVGDLRVSFVGIGVINSITSISSSSKSEPESIGETEEVVVCFVSDLGAFAAHSALNFFFKSLGSSSWSCWECCCLLLLFIAAFV